MAPLHRVFLTLLVLAVTVAQFLPRAQANDDMRHRMDDLVDSVKTAVHDAEGVGRRREVVDLGQTLHLLETKFAGLRAALEQELGTKSSKFTNHNNIAKELMDRSTDLVHGIVTQREELRRLSGDVKEVDSAIRAIREGMVTFERDAAELHKIIADLHITHNELSSMHDETRASFNDMLADSMSAKRSSSHGLFYTLLLVEIAIFVAYLYFKRPGSNMAHKAYGKFG